MTAAAQVGGTTDSRLWDGQRKENRRRRRRLATGVVLLSLIMILGGGGLRGGSGGLFAACISCPNNPSLCIPACGPCPTPTITGDGYSLQSGSPISGVTVDRQGWLNLSWSGGDTDTPHIAYWITSGNDLPMPTLSRSSGHASLNVNSLQAGTTYGYGMTVASSGTDCTTSYATYDGSFSTLSAPSNEYVGWISQLVSNSYEVDQVGSTISGATVWPSAVCDVGYEVGSGTSQGVDYEDKAFALPGTSTTSSGGYGLAIPSTYTTTLYYWIGGTKGYQVSEPETITLSSGGNCVTVTDGTTVASINNPDISLYANEIGYWNATAYVNSTLSSSNDYQQLGLPQNGYNITAIGVGFSHTSDAGCTIGVTNGAVQEVQNYVNILGYQSGYTAIGWVNGSTTGSAKYGGDSSITMDFHTTGVVNETAGNIVFGEAQAYGVGYDISTDTVSFIDPDSTEPAIGNTSTNSTFERTVGPDSTQWINYSNGGSYTSQSGLDLQVGIFGGWDGEGFGGGVSTDLIQLVDLTTVTSDSSHAVDCVLTDSSPTYAYQFIVSMDGTQTPQDQAINAHIWLKDECTPGASGCP